MNITASAAAQAYAAAAQAAGGTGTQQAAQRTATPEQGFGDLLKEALDTVSQTADKANQATADQLIGRANLVDVVTAVAETEVAVQTLVSVRDRVISAYQDVMRMPI